MLCLAGVSAAAPTITTQPQGVQAVSGTSAQFSVAATGTGTLSYQWFFGPVGSGTPILGATQAAYSIVALAPDAGYYYVVVSDSTGSVTSSGALLSVIPSAAVGTAPGSLQVYVGQPFSLDAEISLNGGGNYTYYWEKNNVPIAGATNSYYSVAAASAADAGTYVVVVSNGVAQAESNTLTVTVLPDAAPAITTQPLSQTVADGSALTLSVTATGGPPPFYQWYFNGSAIAGAIASTYSITAVSPANSGSYTVAVTNSAGTITSAAAAITVSPPVAPAITVQPQPVSVGYGAAFDLSVTATGQPAPTYQWYLNGEPIANANGSTYGLYGATPANAGTYTVVATNIAGSVTSSAAAVSVSAAAAPSIASQSSDEQIPVGGATILSVTVQGQGPFTYQWTENGLPIAGATLPGYAITGAAATNAGHYAVT
ncbi:MAG TPA: immunoglobulin domain-containing protein, partial [Opitutaceae bacterium]|nr:immunoglobulin domain-containing protein [Opitutaceae bacterium]